MRFFYRSFGTKTSLANRHKERIVKSFEGKKDAVLRTETKRELQASGKKRPLNHVGSLSSYEWDSDACLQKVFIQNVDNKTFALLNS